MRTKALILGTFVLILTAQSSSSEAGVINGIALEDKGVFQPVVAVQVFTSSMYVKLVSGWGARDGEEHFRLNGETVALLPAGPPVHVWNLYPILIEVPQPGGFADPNAPISFFNVFLGDINNTGQIGSVPDDWTLTQAQIQDGFGNFHAGTITEISDLDTQLPSSNANDLAIEWDLTGVSQTQGRFFLVEYTMTANQVVPEPSTFILAALGLAGLALIARRRLAIRPSSASTLAWGA